MSHSNTPKHSPLIPSSGTVISDDLEQKVARLVVDALLRCGLDPSQCELTPTESHASEASNHSAFQAVPQVGIVAVQGSVISVDLLNSLSIGESEICFSHKAVVTPAAKDWLRAKKITWSRDAQPVESPLSGAKAGVVNRVAMSWLYDSDNPEHAVGVSKQLSQRGLATTALQTPPQVVEPLVSGIILSSLPAVDVDTWGRQRGFRVASVDSTTPIKEIAAALAPQIWILDKSRVPFHGRVSLAAQCIRVSSGGMSHVAPGSSEVAR